MGELPEERLAHAQVAELLPVGHHQARELGAHHLVGPPLRHADQGYALLARGETSAVAARADLLEIHHGADLVLPDHAHQPVHEHARHTLPSARLYYHLGPVV